MLGTSFWSSKFEVFYGFCSESEDVKGNRIKHDLIERMAIV